MSRSTPDQIMLEDVFEDEPMKSRKSSRKHHVEADGFLKLGGMRGDPHTRTRAARMFRTVAVVLLAGSTIILSTVTFAMGNKQEQHDFESQFESFADQIVNGFQLKFQTAMLTMNSFSVSVTSLTSDSMQNWPLVEIPDFAARGWTARQQMKSGSFGLIPIVSKVNREDWEEFAVDNQDWVREAREWENELKQQPPATTRKLRANDSESSGTLKNTEDTFLSISWSDPRKGGIWRRFLEEADFSKGVSTKIYIVRPDGTPIVDTGDGPFTPIWQTSPAPASLTNINFNLLSHRVLWEAIETAVDSEQAVLSKALNVDGIHESLGYPQGYADPVSALYYPVFDTLSSEDRSLVGLLAAELSWTHFFEDSLPSTAHGIVCVVKNACGQVFSYQVDGRKATYLGPGDFHNEMYDGMAKSKGLGYLTAVPQDFAGVRLEFDHCPFTVYLYPSLPLEDEYQSKGPALFASSVVALFFISAAIFFIYDNMNNKGKVDDGQVLVMERMFPGRSVMPSLKTKIMSHLRRRREPTFKDGASSPHFKATLRALPAVSAGGKSQDNSFSNATVMFMSIRGLESWSRRKQGEEKTDLLETVQRSLNVVAKRHGDFNVEIAGDCFVAVLDVEDEHAAILAHFACEARQRVAETFKSMKAKSLSMQFGMHSGHVQAGLKGKKNSLYQLFGDTVDIAYQMMMHSKPNKIHLSVETAELLNLAGKSHWISPRKDPVLVKGKGQMSTFWVKSKVCLSTNESREFIAMCDKSQVSESTVDEEELWAESSAGQPSDAESIGDHSFHSVVDRNVSVLSHYLKKIQARRNATRKYASLRCLLEDDSDIGMGNPIIEEAMENIRMAPFDAKVTTHTVNPDFVELPEEVESQLRLFVSSIASTYKPNEFHNIDHATHVTLTMDRMINKIIEPEEPETYLDFGGKPRSAEAKVSDLDIRSFGIATDPLVQFGLVFSTLVHDVDHVGVPNSQLIKEKSPLAGLYKNKSVAEQNSVDIAWWLLMTPNFTALRSAIYSDGAEMRRFRQVLVNGVVATDIMDRDSKIRRDRAWTKAFRKESKYSMTEELRDLQATVVIEHLLQASDAAHMMQSFSTYLKWSEKQFEEMYQAYHARRADKDPCISWYVAELAFFDKFLIPLATRLRDCGVFGQTGDEYLKNAMENRKLWAKKGRDIVHEMKENFNRKVVNAQDDTIEFQ